MRPITTTFLAVILVATAFAVAKKRSLSAPEGSDSVSSGLVHPRSSPCATPSRPPNPAERSEECAIDARNRDSNGINVDQPKVYDDTLLRQMLQAAETQLASMQVLSAGGISANIGAVTGGTQDISSFGLNIQGGPSIPSSIATTVNGPTSEVATTKAVGTGSTPIPSGTTTVTTNTMPNQSVVTTVTPPTPVVATAPAPTTTLPSTFSVSASDILNEQMELTSEIAGLRLLLEGSLTDRYVTGRLGQFVRPKTTLGFNIALDPDKRYKDAVAVVEVLIRANPDVADSPDAPAITALLPREKTYNVAAITDHSTSVGLGVTTQIAGVSGSWLGGRKTYYVVKDQDTLALPFSVSDDDSGHKGVGFVWQFRPVLGRRYVQAGMRQNFVQIAFPSLPDKARPGWVEVRTYWRRYDTTKGILKEVIPNSLRSINPETITTLPVILRDRTFNVSQMEDLGNGQMLIDLEENFLSGTYVRIGSTILAQGSPSISFEADRMRFIASISDLATKKVFLVGRDGTEVPIQVKELPCNQSPPRPLTIGDVQIQTSDPSNSLVTVPISNACFISSPGAPPLLIVVGGKVFGYKDAPIQRDPVTNTLTALIPTSLLQANPRIEVETLFHEEGSYHATKDIKANFEQSGGLGDFMLGQSERLIFLGQREPVASKHQGTPVKSSKRGKLKKDQKPTPAPAPPQQSTYEFILYGNRLEKARVLDPPNVNLQPVGRTADGATLARIELTAGQVNTQKYILLQRDGDRPFPVQIPSVTSTASAGTPDLKPSERLTVGADQTTVTGDIKDLTKVTFNGNPIAFEKAADGKSVTLKGLSASGVTSTATIKTLVFWFGDKQAEVKIEVVTAKLETVAK
ncbi:MAG TPA: hypothetical protein VI756_12190 [Blastocatellia bacterium]